MKTCEAPDCTVEFEPQRVTAKYHSGTCRQRAARARTAAEAAAKPAPPEPPAGGAEHSLVSAVRAELDKADALGTVPGQLALQIARRIADPECSGVSTLSKELRALLAEATGAKPDPGGDSPAPPEPEEDEVTKARRQRDEARQAAGLA